MRIYTKRGAPNYKEKRMIEAIEKAVLSKKNQDPNFSFEPASNFEELKALHDKLTTEEVGYEEVQDEAGEEDLEKKHKEFRAGMEDTVQKKSEGVIDPFNEAEPIIRDYVMNDGFSSDNNKESEPANQSFAEPTSFAESFELPSVEDERAGSTKNEKAKKDKKEAAFNPSFDDMSGNKKRRSTKKFAKIIVEGVSILAEKGCIWWTTKDITEDKLVKYELEDKMDLQILLTLDDQQQITVREWFGLKVREADTLFKVSKEDKDDLIDSLYEVMLEKGIAPTPTQELIINSVKTFVLDMGLKAYAFNQQIKSVLNQLIEIKNNQREVASQVPFDVAPESDSNPAVEEVQNVEPIGNELAIVDDTNDEAN